MLLMSTLDVFTSRAGAAPLPLRTVRSAFLITVFSAARGGFAFLRRCGGSSCGSGCFRGGVEGGNVFSVHVSEHGTRRARLSQSHPQVESVVGGMEMTERGRAAGLRGV